MSCPIVFFSDGPDEVQIAIDEDYMEENVIRFSCRVNRTNINPDFTTTFRVLELLDNEYNTTETVDDVIYFDVNTTTISGGMYTAECVANNTQFPTTGAVSIMQFPINGIFHPFIFLLKMYSLSK